MLGFSRSNQKEINNNRGNELRKARSLLNLEAHKNNSFTFFSLRVAVDKLFRWLKIVV